MRVPNYVEVETSRYCNRLCEWCPNHTLRNRKAQQLLPWSCLERIVDSLAKISYEGWFAFHNYNEPLANPRIVEELRLVRSKLPSARPTIFTNGDRLTREVFSELINAGLAQMRITIYPKTRLHREASLMALWSWLKRRPFLREKRWEEMIARQGPALVHAGPPEVILISPRIEGYYDRGGMIAWLSVEMRMAPCMLTTHSLSVDYLGNVKMCCNVVTGNHDHREYLLGNVADEDVLELWNTPVLEAMRERHLRADWSRTPICKTCRQELRPDAHAA